MYTYILFSQGGATNLQLQLSVVALGPINEKDFVSNTLNII